MAREIFEADRDDMAEAPREGFSAGVVIFTTIVLLFAIFFMQKALKKYDAGMFKEGQQQHTPDPEPTE